MAAEEKKKEEHDRTGAPETRLDSPATTNASSKPTQPASSPSGPSPSLPSAVQAPLSSLNHWRHSVLPRETEAAIQEIEEEIEDIQKSKWNTRDLWERIGVDVTAAAAAGFAVAPVVSMIDRGIIESASDRKALSASIRKSVVQLLTRPHRYVTSKPFALIFLLYSSTYLSANAVDTLSSTLKNHPAPHTTSGTAKFLTTSATNLSLSMLKDSQFARMFGAAPGARPVPARSFAIFAARDCLTVFASFNLPPRLAPLLPLPDNGLRAGAAQFVAPAAMQLLTSPLHLLGLDLYNRPAADGVSLGSRAAKIAKDYVRVSAARIGRILPAFGVGGVVNTNIRRRGMEKLA